MKQWAAYFSAASLSRGMTQFRNRQVSELYSREHGVEAVVEGDTGVYDVVLTWKRRVGTDLEALHTDCTCPVGAWCKHAVAVFATLLDRERQKKSLLPVPDGWSSEPSQTVPERAAMRKQSQTVPALPIEEPPTVTLITADVDDDLSLWLQALVGPEDETADEPTLTVLECSPQHGWRILPVRAKRLKRVGWGVGKRFRTWIELRRMWQLQPPRRLAWLIDRALSWNTGYGADGVLRLASSHHFRQVIASGLVMMEPLAGGAVTLGETVPGALAWNESADGWRLLPRADGLPPDAQFMRLEQLWWISPSQRRVGLVDLPFSDELLDRITAMPSLPIEVLPDVVTRLRPNYAQIPPPPSQFEQPAPVPVLRAWSGTLTGVEWAAKKVVHDLALVSFRYGQDEIPACGALVHTIGSRRIVRQLGREAARLHELARAGLSCLVDGKMWRHDSTAFPPAAVYFMAQGTIPPAGLALLRATGWDVSGKSAATVSISDLGPLAAELSEDGGWFDLALGTEIDGQRIDLVPLLTPLLRGGPTAWAELPTAEGALLLPHGEQRLLRVPLSLLQGLHDHLLALFSRERSDTWRLNAWDAGVLATLDGFGISVLGGERLRAIATAVMEPLQPAVTPPGLQAELRPYQSQGLAWLQRLRSVDLGGILADDMGLGKTVQVIAHLCAEQAAGRLDRPCLVVCPASMVGTWQRELTRFAPHLMTQVLHGTRRDIAALVAGVIGITTYGVLHRDIEQLAKIPLHIAICDEAQVVKNAGTKAAQALRKLEARQRLCLTGTPLENHLGELHAQVTWAAPGVFGSRAAFDALFVKPIAQGQVERGALLRQRLRLVLLRRTKLQVATDLPPRSESVVMVELGTRQRALYEAIRLAMDARIRDVIAAKGIARSGIEVIEALLRLRQVACDPALLKTPDGLACAESAKLDALAEMLPTMVEDGRRILIFSQFTSFLDRIESEVLQPAKLTWLRLDGQTRDRQSLVERFQAEEVPVFLLSLKAGGTGLTLTAADTVILADPWWNPAVEAQAADRAHRIGQIKPVLVYRLVAAATIEEKVLALQARKRSLAEALYDETGQSLGSLTAEDLAALLAPM